MPFTTPQLFQAWLAANPDTSEGSLTPDQVQFFWTFLKQNAEIYKVLEIGFNSGLSAAAFLEARNNIDVVSVDLGAHEYILKAKRWLDNLYPGRHTLIVGDSTNVLPQLERNFPSYKADLIFVDGGHHDHIPYTDLLWAHKLSKPNTWVIVDDTTDSEPNVVAAVQRVMKEMKFALVGNYKTKDRAWVILKPLY